MNSEHLEPSTTYLVSVRSVYQNNLPSDSSEEVEFTTRECHLYSPFVSFYAVFCIFICRTSLKKFQRLKIKVKRWTYCIREHMKSVKYTDTLFKSLGLLKTLKSRERVPFLFCFFRKGHGKLES